MKKLYSRSGFARLAGVTPRSITYACAHSLKLATVGKRIDAAHPLAAAYLEKHVEKKERVLIGNAAKNEAEKQASLDKLKDELYVDMTLREVVGKYGTDTAFKDWLKAAKLIEDINEKRLKNTETKNELVSRELINIGVIEPINSMHEKLLTDGVKTIARRITVMYEAGRTVDECAKFIADQITSFIRPVKTKVKRMLQNGDSSEINAVKSLIEMISGGA